MSSVRNDLPGCVSTISNVNFNLCVDKGASLRGQGMPVGRDDFRFAILVPNIPILKLHLSKTRKLAFAQGITVGFHVYIMEGRHHRFGPKANLAQCDPKMVLLNVSYRHTRVEFSTGLTYLIQTS